MIRELNKTQLVIGTRVSCTLPYCGRGIIFNIAGEQQPDTIKRISGNVGTMGGNARLDVVFENGSISHQLPESIVRGIQWTIFDEVASSEEIAEALAHAATTKADKQAKEDEAKTAFSAEVDSLKAAPEFAHLKQIGDTAGAALVAANIRADLKKNFPGVKFSVRKDGYDAIYIKWTDGPTDKAVSPIVQKYKSGSFNGMEDIYEYSRCPFTSVFGDVKYVFTSRECSDAAIQQAIDEVFTKRAHNLEGIEKPTPEIYRSGSLYRVTPPGFIDDLQAVIRSQLYNT